MSKPLRGIIESTRTRLEDILNNLPDISPEINPELTREENMNVLDRARSQLLHEIQRVKEAIGILDASNTEWGVYMRTLAGEPLAQEEEIYQETIEFSGSFMELIGKGRDELLILQSRLRDTEETQAQLLNPRIFKSALLPNEDGPKVFEEGATVKPIHLPSLQLPTYDGDPLKWSEFWDAYESAIHTQGIPQVQKFTYLISCVKGKAHTAIEGMAITNANYQEAISILKHRFGNINVIKRSLYTQLRKIPISTGKTVDLRSTLEEVDRVCRQLQSVGEDVNQPNLIMTVQEKLPPAILMDLGRYKSPDELWRMDQLRAQLDALVRIREEAWQIAQHAPKTEGNPPQPRVDSKPWKAKPPPQASTNAFAALTTNDDRSNTTLAKLTTIYPCAFCCETHFNDQCVKFPSRESRQERAKELELCFRCLKQGHDARRCRFTRKCIYCQGEHNRALCTNKKSSMDYRSPTASNVNQRINPTQPMKAHAIIKEVEPNETDQEEREENNVMKISIEEKEKKTAPPTRHEVVLLTAKTKAFNPEMKSRKKEAVDVHIFFDSGSQKSFITQELADKLKLKKESEDTLSIYTFASEQPQQMKSSTVQVEVLLKDGSTKTIQASALPMLTNKLPRKALKENDINLYKQASSRNLAEDIPMKNEVIIPDILIGSDYFWEFLESKETIKCPSGLYLIPSKVGILIGGKQETKEKNKNSNMHTILTSAEEKWNFNPKINPSKIAIRNVEEFWSLEAIGIKDSPDTKDDDLALQQLDDTIMFNNGRYNVKWPWKSEFPQLPDNYWLCYGRLKSLMKRFSGETDLLKKYNDIIQDQLAKEIIEKVEEKDEAGPIQHYLPHHPVVTPSKTTTKVRIVYDASAKMNKNSNSLNDCLYRGPVILPDLCGLLMRFRKAPIALTADIEKAFLQVGLQSDDRDVTRFLWLKDLEKPFSKENVQIYRFCRVTFGVISSPFLLSATLQHHLRKSGRKEALELAENIYVDNVLTGKETVEEAQQLYQETKTLFSQVSMNLREWTSNSKEFRDFLPEEDKLKEPKVKVLGLLWNTETDTLQASLAANSKVTSTVTKREVLQTLASTFDPMGMLAPITVRGKIFFQTLWQDKFDWDEPLPKFLANKWQEIMEDWEKHPNFFVPRHIAPQGMNTRYQLLTFVDASKDAYAAVVYLRVEDENSTETYLLFSKNRLTPKKEISLPRVELLAALIGVRIMKFVANQLKLQVEKKIIWSDSQCVLHWIQSSKYLSTFVTNRVKEIRAEDDIHFRYISTDENPADLSSRGVQAARFEDNSLWWHGPKWLKTSTSQWPEWNMPEFQPNILREINNESKGSKFFHEATLMAIETGENYNPVIKTERFSKWPKLLRVTVHCLRFIKLKIWKRLSEETKEKMGQKLKFLDRLKDSGQINANDIKTATIFTLRQNQLQHFPDVFYALQNNKKNQLIDQLGVSLDEEGILRCGGRLSNADKEETMKYPILLPRKTHATQLIIRDRHELALHSGVQHTLAQLRQEFWILKGRIEVRKAIKSCLLCKKYSVGPYNLPKMPAFPKERVQQANPFQYTGLDYLGPLWIKSVNEKFKVWICLFTCLVTRAIHLEPILDLSAQQFLNCIRRFIARRGKPDKIISDNAPHFKLTQKTMDLAWSPIWEDDNNNNYFAQHKIDWQFITEYAPWQGGFYERLVGVVKQALRKTIGRQCLKFEQFYTLLPEVEAVVNSRPLTYLYNDFASRQTLRPIDFLSPRSEIGIPPLEEDHKNAEYLPPGIDSKQRLLQIWKKSVENLDKFWALWHGEYLLSLRERYQTSHKGPRIHATTLPKLEEVVLIKEEGTPRGIWKLGKIIELKKGRDGETRSAKVILPNKTIINRPINLLYPLEISEEQPQHDLTTTPVEKTKTPSVTTTKPVRPTRGPRVDYRNPIKLFYTLGIMLCIIMTGAQGTACREDEDLTQIQSQTCLKEGVIVMRTSQGNLCWIKKTCPTGHLGNNGTCGPFCACPKWAEQCSYYTGPLPNIKGDLVSILNLAKPNVCSFKPDPRCNENPIHTRLHKIQLYNGTTHFVKALELRRAQATTEEFECQGEGPQVGTPEFCETHQCASTGTKFCYYRNHDIVFFVNEDGELPIKAWGSIPVTIYGPKEVPAENPICVECSLKCIQGGIEITMEKNIGQIEACAKPYCYRMSHPKEKEIIQFPTDVVIKSHEIVVKIWSNGYLIKDFGIQCEASPYCEMIQCVFCWDLIGNPQCAPKWTFLVLFAMLYFGSVTLYLLIKILKYGCQCCYYGSYGLWQCLRLCKIICRRARSKTYEKLYLPLYTTFRQDLTEDSTNERHSEPYQLVLKSKGRSTKLQYKPSSNLPLLTIIISLLLTIDQINLVKACAAVTTLTAQQSMCTVQESGNMECVFTETTRLALVPQGQDSCLLIKDPNGQPIGTLSIEVEKVALGCQVTNEYFTRSFAMKVASSKRCSDAGSCHGEKCGAVRIDSKIKEMDGEANNYPGFTYCAESCGCAGCGCFFCESACLFYRTYAVPASDTTYEIFSCPVWEYKVRSTVRLHLPSGNTQQIFDLKPGLAYTWNNIKLTLTSITTPPVPILGSQFLTDGKKTVLVRASAGSQPVSGTVGEMQCSTREKADRFECYIPHDACICQPQEARVSCHCVERKLEDLFTKIEHVLPLTTHGLTISGVGNKIEAEYNQIASVELQISMEGFRLSTKTEKNKCQVKPIELAGCYNCLTGAKLKFECKTDFGEALAHVSCGKGAFSTICTPQGVTATATMNFPSAVVHEICTVLCPAGSNTFPIDATLVFIEKDRLGTLTNVISAPHTANNVDVGFLTTWLYSNWMGSLTLILGVGFVILLSIIFFPLILQTFISCVTRTSFIFISSLSRKNKQRSSSKQR